MRIYRTGQNPKKQKLKVAAKASGKQEKAVEILPLPAAKYPSWRDAGLVFFIALAVRLVYAVAASRTDPFFAYTIKGFDQNTFQEQAASILKGDWLLSRAGLFYYSPIYSYFAALVYSIFGLKNFWALHVLQAVLGAGTWTLCFILAGTWLSRRAAFVAAVLWILAAPLLFYEQELLHEGLMLLFYATLLWGLRTAQIGRPCAWGRLVAAGAACVLAMIGRGNALALLLTLPIWILFTMQKKDVPGHPARRLARLGWSRAGLFLVGAGLVFMPLLIRNHVVLIRNHAVSRWSLGMENGRVLFYLGNCADSTGEFVYTPRFLEAQKRQAEAQKQGRSTNVYLQMFLEDLENDPGAIFRNLARKTYYLFSARDLPDNLNFQFCRKLITPLHWTPVQWEWLVPLGLVGLFLSWVRRSGWSLLWLFTAIFSVSLILIIPIGRYRLPILIPLTIWAGFAVQWFMAQLAARSRAKLVMAGGALCVLILGLYRWNDPMRTNEFFSFTLAAIEQKEYAMAHRVLDIGYQTYPMDASIMGRGLILARAEGDRAGSRQLAETLWERQSFDIQTARQMADIFAQDGQPDRARLLLQSILRTKPDDEEARRQLEALGPQANQ